MKSMPGRRGVPQTTSHGSLEGVYKQRQPGCSPWAPGTERRPRQQQRTSLRRSASLVLGQAHGDISVSDNAGYRSGASYPSEPLSQADRMPTVEHPSEHDEHGYPVGRGWPKWSDQPSLLREMPARLEGCRQRLAAADWELRNCNVVTGQASKTSPEADYSGEIGLLQRHLDEACKDVPPWHSDEETKPQSPWEPPSSSATASFALGEPAPEPPLPPSSAGWEAAPNAADLAFADEALATAAEEHSQDLRLQLSTIEERLFELDKKWQAAERERIEASRANRELQSRLLAVEDRERKLQVRLDNEKAESKALRKTIGVSEGEAQATRAQLDVITGKEAILHNQVNYLQARIYASEGDNQVLQQRLDESDQDKEALTERLHAAELDNQALIEKEALAEKASREARDGMAEQIAHLREAVDEARMELASEKIKVVSAERSSSELREQLQAALDRPPPPKPEATLLHSETDLDHKDFMTHKLTVLLTSSVGPPLPVRAAEEEAADGIEKRRPALRPAQCQVDTVLEEVRLVPLGAVGPACVIPFKEIMQVIRDDNEFSLDIEWSRESDKEGTSMQRVMLDTTDEQSLGAIIAALNMKSRIAPGSMAATPATVTPRTPPESERSS
mmetsp:Transcript_90421/g.165907  ORF Transcript_90421/g.165907 Transcript_90421/m.165907 type:complete len:621 (-) Transcript_90421:82-1944(-)